MAHGGLGDFGSKLTKNTISNCNFLWRTWGFGFELTKNTSHPQNRTSHGGLRDFDSKLTRSTSPTIIENSHVGLRDFGSDLTKNTPPPVELLMEDCAGNWCVETNRCIPYVYRLVVIFSSFGGGAW